MGGGSSQRPSEIIGRFSEFTVGMSPVKDHLIEEKQPGSISKRPPKHSNVNRKSSLFSLPEYAEANYPEM